MADEFDVHSLSAPTGGRIESPSLFAAGGRGPTAYEVKFLLSEALAGEVAARLAGRLDLDPYADPNNDNSYQTTSVYTDTPALDVFHRSAAASGRKYRVRGYGADGPIFVERKKKSGDEVRKRRTGVPGRDVSILSGPDAQAGWEGAWFCQEAAARHLRPVCRITYDRVAYMGRVEGAVVRATFDRRARGARADGWRVTPVLTGDNLLPDLVICEFKFRTAMPALFKSIVGELRLSPAVVSKYRLYMGTVHPVAPKGSAVDA